MESTVVILFVYGMIMLLPLHGALYLGIRNQRKKNARIVLQLWRAGKLRNRG